MCFFCDGTLNPMSKDTGEALIDKTQKYTRKHVQLCYIIKIVCSLNNKSTLYWSYCMRWETWLVILWFLNLVLTLTSILSLSEGCTITVTSWRFVEVNSWTSVSMIRATRSLGNLRFPVPIAGKTTEAILHFSAFFREFLMIWLSTF